ncbi:TPA: hypothetical protein HJP37_004595 [Escherichia coli]|nr:hypothetical protein [Escherichia coli]
MINMPQNGPVDQGEHEKDSTNVVPIDAVNKHKRPANSYVDLTLEDMEQRFIFLTETSAIYDTVTRKAFTNPAAFRYACAACEEQIGGRFVPVASLWLKSRNRNTKSNLIFAPGQGEIVDIDGSEYVNTWRKIQSPRRVDTAKSQPVVDLINALFTDQADDFLDGLAFHWQHPEAQFNHAWLHISDQTGTGRGRLTMLLSAVWKGELAVIDDLGPFKSGQGVFSDRIIRKTFYVIEEMMDVGKDKYTAVANLNNAVTKDAIWINPKGEKGYEQLHRAFIFVQSNEIDCMPILAKDSRWKVAHYTGNQPFPDEWFAEFNEQCHPNSDMVIAFRQLLAERDVTNYNPGRVRTHSLAKLEVMEATKGVVQESIEAVLTAWQCPYLPTPWLKIILKDTEAGHASDAAISKTMKRLGCFPMKNVTRVTKTTVCRCWVLPGHNDRKGVKEELNSLMLDVFGAVPVTVTDAQVIELLGFEGYKK